MARSGRLQPTKHPSPITIKTLHFLEKNLSLCRNKVAITKGFLVSGNYALITTELLNIIFHLSAIRCTHWTSKYTTLRHSRLRMFLCSSSSAVGL